MIERPPFGAVVEAAPARRGIRWLAIAIMVVFAGLAVRTSIAMLGGSEAAPRTAVAQDVRRADLLDRNGSLLATSLQFQSLWAEPRWVSNPDAMIQSLASVLPGFDQEAARMRLTSKRDLVPLQSGLTPPQRAAVHALGLPGLVFKPQTLRVYPNESTAGRVLGRLNAKGEPISGVELGLARRITAASQARQAVQLSLDLRIQHAAEAELVRALSTFAAQQAAAIVVDARTGEVLALASAPLANPNAPLRALPPVDLLTGAAFEVGSTMKPFTVAAALDAGLTKPDEMFDTRKPLIVPGLELRDHTPAAEPVDLAGALARSSNVMAGALAIRLGRTRQATLLEQLGLVGAPPLPVAGSQRYRLPPDQDDAAVAANGYGRGPLFTVAALAGAYTTFANGGERTPLTLERVRSGDPVARQRVFTPETAATVLTMLRRAIEDGTGARAEAPGLDIAGKTGTSEKIGPDGRYDPDRNVALFAAVFPAHAPRYVMVVALDEPQRTPASGGNATGGAVAAPTAGRIAARIAPFLDIAPINGAVVSAGMAK